MWIQLHDSISALQNLKQKRFSVFSLFSVQIFEVFEKTDLNPANCGFLVALAEKCLSVPVIP